MNFKTRALEIIKSQSNVSIQTLIEMRQKALRKGVWFKALSNTQRAIINLTINCVKSVRSFILVRALQSLSKILSQAIEQGYLHKFFITGRSLAAQMSIAAFSWGNRDALKWADDPAYIIFLGMNRLSGWSYPHA